MVIHDDRGSLHGLPVVGELARTTVWRAKTMLEEAGVVVEVDKHKMGRNWRSEEILRALDTFAQRARRLSTEDRSARVAARTPRRACSLSP